MFIKEKIISILEYFLAICIVINANTIWNYTNTNNNLWIYTLIILLLLVLISIKDIWENKRKLYVLGFLVIGITLYNSLFIMINGEDKSNFIIGFLGVLIGSILYTATRIDKEKRYSLILKISNVIVVLAIISLYFYIKGSILKEIQPSSHILLRWGPAVEIPNYHNLYYVTQVQYILGKEFIRNTGIFTEAPMYGFCLSIALIVELFFRKTNTIMNKLIISISTIILAVTIMTTLSTTAIGIMAVAIPLRALSYIINNIKKSKIKIIIGTILLIIFVIIGGVVGGLFLKNKVDASAGGKYGSFTVRKDDFRVGYETWKKDKIIGCGFNQYQYVQQEMRLDFRGSDIGGSSGLMKVLPEGGIMLLMVYLIPFILAMLYGVKKRDLNVIFAFILIYIIFTVTAIQYRYLMIYILGLGFTYALNLGEKKIKKE